MNNIFGLAKKYALGSIVPVVKVTGMVDIHMTSKLVASLKRIDPGRSEALAVVFNT